EKHAPFSDLRSYCNSTIVAFCKRKKIPVFMMEHGAISIVDFGDLNKCVFFRFDNETCDFEERYYRPDIMALSFDHERKGYSRLIGPGTVVKALGTVRYDRAWNEYIQGISVRIDKSGIRKNKFTVLYVVAPLSKEANEVMTPEILAIAEKFPETELWVKLHPRYQWAISDDISKGSDRIRLFRNDVDINVLLHYADLVISPLSSVLFQAIIDGIPVILYERWKKLMNFTGRTAFEDTECIFRASEPEMLYNHCSRVIAGERPSMRDFREFYKKKISSGIDMDKSMVEGYLKAIREACR
ncbi:MAG TPA: CDP-glycerol glycerophosphotransferase family protein, partial [Candidatus Omnitrophota bacterium]|nr:CDP-glycerol glycerophosphotransferase family protein [Candidatus Omnitrophota bacterium]